LENSQYNKLVSSQALFHVASKIISPNNDGIDDFLFISYQMKVPGYKCSIYLLGLNGNMICKILDNQLLGTNGNIIWNGLNREQVLPTGQYIIYIVAFHLNARTVKEKILMGIR
jgi:hypothetical protein